MQSACVCVCVRVRCACALVCVCACVRVSLCACLNYRIVFCTHVQTGYVIVNECVVNALHTIPHSVLVFTRWQ